MSRSKLVLKFGSFLVVLLFLVGCATGGKLKFDKEVNTNIKKIALLRVNEPEHIQIAGHPGFWRTYMLGGLLGYYIVEKPAQEKRKEVFLKAKDDKHLHFGPAMAVALQQELTKKGYEIVYLQDNPHFGKNDYYSQLQTDADAILSVGLGVVGYAETKDIGYMPTLMVYSELFHSSSKKVIYARRFYIGPVNIINVEKLFPDEKYRYNSFDTLIKIFDEAVQGIIDCQNKIAVRIAEHLK